jgi:hypothetical protein
MFVLAVALSILGLLIGPALVAVGGRRPGASAALDGLTLGVVPALVALRLVPHLYDEVGVSGPLLVAAGYAGFWFLERRGAHGADVGAELVVPTLAVHSVFDGAALALAFTEHGTSQASSVLGFALVAHRLPEGLFIGTTLVPRLGLRRTLRRVGVLVIGTLLGAAGGQELVAHAPEVAVHASSAVGLGVMVRLVVHRHAPAPAQRHAAVATVAFAGGIAIALLVPSPHDLLSCAQPRELSVAQAIVPLVVETAPALLMGFAGIAALRWLRSRVLYATRSVLGALTRDGAAAEGVDSFILAPLHLLDGVGVALSFALLGPTIAAMRVAIGAIGVAMGARAAAGSGGDWGARHSPPSLSSACPPLPNALVYAFSGPARRIGPAYVLGLLLAACVEAGVPRSALESVPPGVVFGACLALAAPIGIAPEALLPALFMLSHKGLGIAELTATSVLAPIVSLPALTAIRSRAGILRTVAFGFVATLVSVGTGALAATLHVHIRPAHVLLAHEHGPSEWVCAGLVVVGVLAGLVRVGPRGWFRAGLVAPATSAAHDHGHIEPTTDIVEPKVE